MPCSPVNGHVGRPAAGLEILAETLPLIDKVGERVWRAELYRLKASCCSGRRRRQAEACFHQAIDVARRQQAKTWELRAAMSLARLWQQQGKRADAYQPAPIYGWFTEGFDVGSARSQGAA